MEHLLERISELATMADEEGYNVLCLALLHVVKGITLPPSVARRWVNTESLLLEALEEARRVK